ncbi:MAG: ribonuclease J [Patescibacteria group bacterium]
MNTQPNNSGRHGRSRGQSSRSSRGPARASWQHTPNNTSTRKGDGVRYGKLELTPQNHYAVHPTKTQEGKLRVIVMGGNEEVGRNMTLLEYGDDIILIDMGIQFGEEHMRGIDGIVQDFSYLKGREHQVRAVIITHMHMDHIGAIPFLMPLLPGVPVFSAPITLSLIAKKLEYMPDVKVDLRPVDEATHLTLGNFKVSFMGVSHSVPSALAIIIDTPCGKIVHTGDFKVDLNPTNDEDRTRLESMRALGDQNVLALLSDSTNAPQSGHQLMEHEVAHDLEKIVAEAKGRLLFGMISSNVERLRQIITIAQKHGKHVAVGGLSLKTTLEIAENLGYIKPFPGTLIDISEIQGIPPNKIIAIFPGAQGESNAAFYKLADNQLRDLRVTPGDTVVFSSSVIPGNERSVQFITDKFYRLGAKVVNYRALNIHAGGHAKAADLGEVTKMIKPKYLIPIEGHHAFLHHHAQAAIVTGFPRQNIFIADNGQIIEFDQTGQGKLMREKIDLKPILIDAETLGVVDLDTLRERKRLGDEGIVIVSNNRVECLGFRHRGAIRELEQKLLKLVRDELPRLAKQRDAKHILQGKLEKFIEKETRATPYVWVNITQQT